ncbi:MAG TPA: DoxX family protein [Bacteroidales bacterium]|nr:DoxX family protein [Bacteroidales bacterium]HBZ21727.1 DoxX family protein [Bacteroidales bacterium]
MKKGYGLIWNILHTGNDSKMIFARIITGLIFISEGIQKFMIVSMLGPAYFKELGFGHPEFWSKFTGSFEITFGLLICIGFLTRVASIPLLIILTAAFFKANLPVLLDRGFITFAHEFRVDFALVMLLIMMVIHGGGKWSVDLKISEKKLETH